MIVWKVIGFLISIGSFWAFLSSIGPAADGDYAHASYLMALSISLGLSARECSKP